MSLVRNLDVGNPVVPNELVPASDLTQRIEEDGFAVAPSCLDEDIVTRIGSHFVDASYGIRNLLAVPFVRELAGSAPVRALAACGETRLL
jgi:hypothetical protein